MTEWTWPIVALAAIGTSAVLTWRALACLTAIGGMNLRAAERDRRAQDGQLERLVDRIVTADPQRLAVIHAQERIAANTQEHKTEQAAVGATKPPPKPRPVQYTNDESQAE